MNYGYILIDQDTHIVQARSQATYEDTLDAQLLAVMRGLIYIPLSLGQLVDELSKVEIYE